MPYNYVVKSGLVAFPSAGFVLQEDIIITTPEFKINNQECCLSIYGIFFNSGTQVIEYLKINGSGILEVFGKGKLIITKDLDKKTSMGNGYIYNGLQILTQ